MHILFVCTGNICRSPTAERLATVYGALLRLPDFSTSSAGTRALVGHPIHDDAVPVLERLGGDASNFSARQLTERMTSRADLVLTMTRSHRDAVLAVAPHQLHRTFTLSEAARLASEYKARSVTDLAAFRSRLAAGEASDIPDPIGHDAEYFSTIGSHIAEMVPSILEVCRTNP